MNDIPIIIADIDQIKYDELLPGKPYIPSKPRAYHALAYIIEGNLRYTCGSFASELQPNEILFIRAGYTDLAECISEMPARYIVTDFKTLDNDFILCNRFSAGKYVGNLLESFAKAQHRFKSRGFGYKMECIEILYGIINSLRRGADENAYKFQRVLPAIELLEARISDPTMSAYDMASVCGISTGRLNGIIRELYGVTTSQYIRMRRMECACTLLRNQSNSIGDVAIKCGYGDIYSFSHAFKSAFGVSPAEWRKN